LQAPIDRHGGVALRHRLLDVERGNSVTEANAMTASVFIHDPSHLLTD